MPKPLPPGSCPSHADKQPSAECADAVYPLEPITIDWPDLDMSVLDGLLDLDMSVLDDLLDLDLSLLEPITIDLDLLDLDLWLPAGLELGLSLLEDLKLEL